MSILYVLELKDNYVYVGKTNNLELRIEEHREGKACSWTEKHPFVKIISYKQLTNILDEDNTVKEYMIKYGIDKVRGGSYVTDTLKDYQLLSLNREFRGAADVCFKCGSPEHWVKDCNEQKSCTRCGRNNHIQSKCYAKTHINGTELLKDKDSVLPPLPSQKKISSVLPPLPQRRTPPQKKDISLTITSPSIPPGVVIPSSTKVEPPQSNKVNDLQNPPQSIWDKISNEITNSNSDLRTGRFFSKLFG